MLQNGCAGSASVRVAGRPGWRSCVGQLSWRDGDDARSGFGPQTLLRMHVLSTEAGVRRDQFDQTMSRIAGQIDLVAALPDPYAVRGRIEGRGLLGQLVLPTLELLGADPRHASAVIAGSLARLRIDVMTVEIVVDQWKLL